LTAIVGVQHEGRVYIGGDSAGVSGYGITVRSDVKVFRNGPYVMGFTTSFRMGQLLHYAFAPPKPEGNLDAFMVTTFIDSVRGCLREGGWLTRESEQDTGGTFLVGVNGRLFEINSDFQVGHSSDGYLAVGCGAEIALGSLHTTQGLKPRARIHFALDAASHHSAGVCPPYTIEVAK
jgi:hypothetical protein